MGHIAKESKTGYTVWYKQYIESECKCWGDVCKSNNKSGGNSRKNLG